MKRTKTRRYPLLLWTANAFSEDVKKAIDSGMDAHVAKPIDLEVLLDTLKKYIRKEP